MKIDPFQYPATFHQRRHEPCGYANPKSYKPWLRDEFSFRCVYCLVRERWCPEGSAVFSVEHILPKEKFPDLYTNYTNLAYSCCRCNASKGDDTDLLDPTSERLREHLLIEVDGTINGLSKEGTTLIAACQLDRQCLVEFRRDIIHILQDLEALDESIQKTILQRYFGFPSNLPRLNRLAPPEGNVRPDGVSKSFYTARARGELPDFY